MADVKISALPAVVTQAGTDEFAINQSGTSKKMTLTQLLVAGIPGAFSTLACDGDVTTGGDALASALKTVLNTAAGQLRTVQYQTGGLARWGIRAEATAEGGSDAGSDLEIVAHDDAGAAIGDALKITRADMAAVFGGNVRAPLVGIGAAPDAGIGILIGVTGLTGATQVGADAAQVFGSAATVAGIGVRAAVETAAASFTMVDAYGVYVPNATKGAGSTITNLYGVYIAAQTPGSNNWNLYSAGSGKSYFGGEVEIDGALNHDGATWGLAGATPAAPQTGYTTFTNLSTDRTCDADTVTVAELADIVGTLIVDLKAKGVVAA